MENKKIENITNEIRQYAKLGDSEMVWRNKRIKIIKAMEIRLKKENGKITENNNEVLEVMKTI